MTAVSAPRINYEITDGIMTVTINRPEVRNAVDGTTARELADAFTLMDESDEVRVGILTGAGGNFSAGMDLKAYLTSGTPASVA
jgi:enoyl-CoA hydratase